MYLKINFVVLLSHIGKNWTVLRMGGLQMRNDVVQTSHASVGGVKEFVVGGQFRDGHIGKFGEQFLRFRFSLKVSKYETMLTISTLSRICRLT